MTDGRLGRSRAPFSGRPKGGAASAAGSHSQSPLRFDQSDGSPLSRSPPRPRTICGRGYAGSGVVSAETSLAHLVGMSASPDGLPHWVRRQVLAAGRWETTESSPRAEGEAARWLAAPAGKSRIARAQRATEAGSIIVSAAVMKRHKSKADFESVSASGVPQRDGRVSHLGRRKIAAGAKQRDLHSFVPLARGCAGHGLPRGSRSLGLPPPHGWLNAPWVRLVRRCSLAALHKAARSRVAS